MNITNSLTLVALVFTHSQAQTHVNYIQKMNYYNYFYEKKNKRIKKVKFFFF